MKSSKILALALLNYALPKEFKCVHNFRSFQMTHILLYTNSYCITNFLNRYKTKNTNSDV